MAPADPVPTRRARAGGSRRLRFAVLALPASLLLLVAALFCGRWWLEGYLRSEGFRHLLEGKISQMLRADAHLDPLRWQGSDVFTAGFDAKGGAGSPLGTLNADQLHAELNLRALWHRVWRIDSITCERLQTTLPAGQREARGTEDPLPRRAEPPSVPNDAQEHGWLPNRVEVGEVRIEDFSLAWPGGAKDAGGGFQHVQVVAKPGGDEGTWVISGEGGKLVQQGMPTVRLEQTRLKTTPHEVFINQVAGQVEAGGKVELSGRQELGGSRELDLTAVLDGVPVERFLPEDWRARLQGAASGQVHVTGSAGEPDSWRAQGHLDLRDGRLIALPFLDELAVFTASTTFRQAVLQASGADFEWSRRRLTISRLVLESAGLLRMEGGFTVENGQIDGRMEVGVSRNSLRWLAGAGARVFTEPERAGYVWTSVRLTGPVRNPTEDLSPRLASAIQEEALDKAKKGAGTIIDTAGSLLDLLRPR